MKKPIFIFNVLLFVVITINAQQSEFPELTGPCLGQKPPETAPEIFAPGIISTIHHEHSSPSFSPDGKEIFYSVFYLGIKNEVIMNMRFLDGRWTSPEVATFSGQYRDGGPSFSSDGEKIFFYSKRPIGENREETKGDLWVSRKTCDGWSKAMHLGLGINTEQMEMTVSVTNNDVLYFSSIDDEGVWSIFRSEPVGNKYNNREFIGKLVGDEYSEWCPFISPDESYLLFSAYKLSGVENNDIFISFRQTSGSWGKAISLGEGINTVSQEQFPRVSNDGKYLFFTSNREQRNLKYKNSSYYENPLTSEKIQEITTNPGNGKGDIYWVDTKVIEEFKSRE